MRTARSSRRTRALTALLAAVAAVGIVAGTPVSAGAAGGSLTVGAKNFSGASVISQLWAQALQKKGYSITFRDNLGATEIVYPALKNGDIDAYGDYQGTLLTFLGGQPTGNTQSTYKALTAKLAGTGIVASTPAPAVDVNGFYVMAKTAQKYHLKTLSDVAKVASKLTFGGPQECQARPLCLGSTEQGLYGLQFKEVRKLDAGGPITTSALSNGDIDVGLLFTGSSVLPKGAVLLTDNKGLQPADNPVFLVRKAKATSGLLAVVNAVSAKLTTAAYSRLTLEVQNQKLDPAAVAGQFLKQNHLA
jgi:osmoprotectant transport system substrate-binding protein